MPAFKVAASLAMASIACLAYFFGAYSYRNDLQPIHYLRSLRRDGETRYVHDELGRLVRDAGKIERECPLQDDQAGVILAIGQSNAANGGEAYETLANENKIYNFWDGKCYDALPPLLGATGEKGSFLPLLADRLITSGVYGKVVIVASGVGSTNVARWGGGGDLQAMLIDVIRNLAKKYRVTAVVWHQGESDFRLNTSEEEYRNQFIGVLAMLRENSVDAPVYMAIASRCDDGGYWERRWRPSNPVTEAQKKLVHTGLVAFGADTDNLGSEHFRLADICHFNLAGEMAAAAAYADAMGSHHTR